VRPQALATWREQCGTAYVELGPVPAPHQVLVCARPLCTEHPRQLDWGRQDPGRIAAYAELVEMVDRSAIRVEQGSLL
jgi:hypothetical protein